jgi:hypothetical protein
LEEFDFGLSVPVATVELGFCIRWTHDHSFADCVRGSYIAITRKRHVLCKVSRLKG